MNAFSSQCFGVTTVPMSRTRTVVEIDDFWFRVVVFFVVGCMEVEVDADVWVDVA